MFNYLKSKSLLSGVAVYLLSNILIAAIPFALLPILTRYLTPSEYGEVAMFQVLLGGVSAFVGLNVVGAAGRKYYDGDITPECLRDFVASCLQILTVSGVVIFLLLYVLKAELSKWFGLGYTWILLAVVVAMASFIVQLRLNQWQVRKQALGYGALQVSQSVFHMLLSLLFVVLLLRGADGRIFAHVLSAVLFGALAILLLYRDGLLGFLSWRPAYVKEALEFGVPLIPHAAGAFLLSSVDRWVINSEMGLAEAGIYMVAAQLSGVASLVFAAINSAFVPWLFERLQRGITEEKKQIVRYTYAWFGVILLGALSSFELGPSLVEFIAGDDYTQAGELIGWLCLGQSFSGMYLMVTNYVFYSKKTGLLSFASILSGVINVCLAVFLINFVGLKGVAFAFAASMGLRFLLTWWVAHRLHPMPWLYFLQTKPGCSE